jgi:hypothetical protein
MRVLPALVFACAGLVSANAAVLRLAIIDSGTGQPVPGRIHLKDAAGKFVGPIGLPFWHDHFVCGGVTELDLPAGTYHYEIERGPEYSQATGSITVPVAGVQSITNQIRRLLNLSHEGWWSGELHVHRPITEIELLMQAEDLHIAPVITWWNNQNIWANRALPPNPVVRFDSDRFYHLLGGEDERGGGALLYFNLNQPLNITGAAREFPSPMKFLTEARQESAVWVDIEKPFWYDAPLWLASGQVDSIGIANNHMHRGGMLTNEAWGRPRDRHRLPDPQGNGLWTQEIYYHALNCGLRVPPSAGSASGVLPNPVGYNRVYVKLDGELSYGKWWEGLKAGRVFVSNGPLLRCRANGQWPGHVFKAPAGQGIELKLEAALDSRDPLRTIEVIQNGRVVRTISASEWKRTGSLGDVRFNESGWFLVRAIADVPETFRFASTGPFYVETGSNPRRVSKTSAQFFLDWVRERASRIKLNDPRQQEEVLQSHRTGEKLWQEKLAQANAE